MSSKQEHFFSEVEKFKERYRQFPSAYLRKQLPRMKIKAAAAAARAVLRERELTSSEE
ncbi:MAG TPA: hypothetical protein VIH72_08015 [Candidatus Acidoferrales bacterium]|jgi:hypothetical protein